VAAKTPSLTDPKALRAIAHPLRVRLYELLMAGGPATVSELAEKLGAMVGTVSYHLRQLEAYGYIEAAPELAKNRRETWWRAVPGGLRWSEVALEQAPGGREASDAARRVLLGRQIDRLRVWIERAEDWDPRWRSAAFSTDMLLTLTPDELEQFGKDVSAVVHRWVEETRDGGSPDGADRQQVFFFAHAFPFEQSSG
jgi:DNA-binding transcriptional ArsR family regulator